MTENAIVMHDEPTAITTPGATDGSVSGVPVVEDFGLGTVISGRLVYEIASITHSGFAPELRVFLGPTAGTTAISGRIGPNFADLTTVTQTLTLPFSNMVLVENSPTGIGQFFKMQFFGFGTFSIDVKVTLFEGTAFIVQSKVAPVLGANVYMSISDAEAQLLDAYPNNVSFSALPEDQKGPTLIKATARIEREVVILCQPRGSSLVDTATQTLLWPRLNAYSAIGPIIVDWLDSWEDAILLYADEIAEALLLGEDADEPAEDKGLVEAQLDAGGAQYRERWAAEGSTADFFHGRDEIFSLLGKSFPFGGAS